MNKLEDIEKICVDEDQPVEGGQAVKDPPKEVLRIIIYTDGSYFLKTEAGETKGFMNGFASFPLAMMAFLAGGLRQ